MSLGTLQHRSHHKEQEETLHNNSVFNDSTFNIILIYTQFILDMASYHTTFKVIYLIWQNCILVIYSDCCPDDGLIGRNM
jgi:hypothetical protein